MANPQIKLNSAGVRALLTGPEMQDDLKRRADAIAGAAGPGMDVEPAVGRSRARVSIITATDEARKAEATSRALTNAIDAGR